MKCLSFKMLCIVLTLLLANTAVGQGQQPAPAVPELAARLFKTTGLEKRYEFASHLKPSHLSGDFDGDRKPDVAILIRQKAGGKIGIAVCHSSTRKVFLIGAGTELGNGGDNFEWMDLWKVLSKAAVAKEFGKTRAAPLRGDALHVEKSESASALIYWNGRRYVWRQLGD